MKYIMIVIGALLLGCTDENKSRHALESQGFTEITFTGYSAWACGEGDDTSTGFHAKNPVGKMVEGTVCCGYLSKACTIRW